MAFFCMGFIWALFNRLWTAGILVGFIWIVANSVFQPEVAHFSRLIVNHYLTIDNYIDSVFYSASMSFFIWYFIPGFIFGYYGNEMLESKLSNDGYRLVLTIDSENSKEALIEYNRSDSSSPTNKSVAPKKPLPSKISAQTLFIRQKREINRKLKQKLITKKTAETQMKKAAELEEMRLIIENKGKKPKVKNEVKPKKTTSKSKGDFDYVEKLKDITALRDEGAISQAEFRKLKKKIIDSL
jgi:hypothetical protein